MRRAIFTISLVISFAFNFWCFGNCRVIVTTDIGGTDPDDEQSMIHLLLMSNNIDIEGIICQMAFIKSPIGINTLNNIIDAYQVVENNLRVHDKRYPTAAYLRSISTIGQTEVGMGGVGKGKDTQGSELIIRAVDKNDSRPIWLTAWGGMNTIAQALWKVRNTRSKNELEKFIDKIRIYDILGQCDAGAWIAKNFPEIKYIRARDVYNWAPDDDWTSKNIQAFGAMGKVYPTRRWATEGDSPSFLFLVDNGLNMPDDISAGGWGGRFSPEKKEGVRGMDWVARNHLDEMQYDPYYMYTNPDGEYTMMKWSDAIKNDFAARILWSCNDMFSDANHHPEIRLNKENTRTSKPLFVKTKAKQSNVIAKYTVSDIDGDEVVLKCYIYKEASEYYQGIEVQYSDGLINLIAPETAKGKTIHLILEATDNGYPALTTYRRIIVKIS